MLKPIPAWQPPLVEQFVSTDESNVLIHYLGDVFDWHGYVKFLSLAALRETSRDVPLEKLFVEPHIAPEHLLPDALEANLPPPTQALSAALAENPRLVLLGDPGSGKSTVVNWICTSLGRGTDGPLATLLGGPLVPLPFILRELGIGREFARIEDVRERWHGLLSMFLQRPVAAQLREERETHGGNVNASLVVKMFESGQAIVLLDGIDEIGDIRIREALREAIHEGMRRYPRARWVLTSRIVGYDEARFDSIPLETVETETGEGNWDYDPDELPPTALRMRSLSKYPGDPTLLSVELAAANLLYLAPFNDVQVEHFTRLWWAHHESNPHLAGTKPAQFLSALRQSHGARSLARLPHLLTMIALIYRVRAELPDGRALLYSFIADAYLGTLDKERGLEHLRPIPYNVEEMSRWLAAVGWDLQKRRGVVLEGEAENTPSEVLLGHAELLAILERVIRPKPSHQSDQPPPTARATAELFLEYAGRRSGLLLPRGEGRYAFLHLSFQEYFAALQLRDEVTDPEWWNQAAESAAEGSSLADLRRYAASPAWRETLIFLWESASLISPKLPQRLIEGLCQWKRDPAQWGAFPAPTAKQMKDKGEAKAVKLETQRVLLAAALSVNPHVDLLPEARRALWKRCWTYEISRQNAAWEADRREHVSHEIASLLLSRTACHKESVEMLRESVVNTQPHALEFGDLLAGDLRPLAGLSNLQRLDLSGSAGLSDLRPLAGLSNLRRLDLSGIAGLSDLRPLAGLSNLQVLDLSGSAGLSDLSPLAELSNLQVLDLSGSAGLSDLRPLAGLSNLQVLVLSGIAGLSDLSPLAGLSNLRRLDLSGIAGLSDLRPLAGLSNLQVLYLSGSAGLSDLSPLAGLSNLQGLYLSGIAGLSDLRPLAELSNLQGLYLSGIAGLSDLRPLAGLSNLQVLVLSGIAGLSDLGPLAGLSNLQGLYLSGIAGLSDLRPLAGLSNLQYLDLSGSAELSDLSPLAGLSTLKVLDLGGSSVLNEDEVAQLKRNLPEVNIWRSSPVS